MQIFAIIFSLQDTFPWSHQEARILNLKSFLSGFIIKFFTIDHKETTRAHFTIGTWVCPPFPFSHCTLLPIPLWGSHITYSQYKKLQAFIMAKCCNPKRSTYSSTRDLSAGVSNTYFPSLTSLEENVSTIFQRIHIICNTRNDAGKKFIKYTLLSFLLIVQDGHDLQRSENMINC